MNCIAPSIYKRRNPQATVFYQVVQNTFLEWSGNYSLRHDEVLPAYVEKEFNDYFKCGILAHGFARAYCASCGSDFIVGFSCKKRGVCPSCNTKHMTSITMHLLEKVLPKLLLRQWGQSVPKWLRYHLKKDAALASQVLRIFINEIEKQLKKSCDGITDDAKLGALMILTATELFDNLAKLIPPPHRHRHHYHGVLAPINCIKIKKRSQKLKFCVDSEVRCLAK